MSSLFSVSEPVPAIPPPSSTATQLWLGEETNNGIALCSAAFIQGATAAFQGGAETLIGTEEPAEAAISVRVTDQSLRQELEKFKELLRRGKSQGFVKMVVLFSFLCAYYYLIDKESSIKQV